MEQQDGSGGLVIRRAKDRINKPMNGYMDMLMNVEIAGFVGELQLSLERQRHEPPCDEPRPQRRVDVLPLQLRRPPGQWARS